MEERGAMDDEKGKGTQGEEGDGLLTKGTSLARSLFLSLCGECGMALWRPRGGLGEKTGSRRYTPINMVVARRDEGSGQTKREAKRQNQMHRNK